MIYKLSRAYTAGFVVLGILLLAACGGAEERKAAYFEKGSEWFTQANYEKARLDFQNALQIDPNHVEARFMLAQTLEKLDEPKQAAGHYSRVVELNPNHIKAKSRLARIYVLGGAKDKAKKLADEVIIADRKNSTALTVLATLTSLDGKVDEAIVQARSSLDSDPENADTVALLASLYVRQDRYNDAVALLTDVIKRTNDKSFKTILAGIFVTQEKYDDAIDIVKNLLTEEPANLAYVSRLASLYVKVKRSEDAEKLLRTTIDTAPDNHEAKMLLINYLAAEKDLASAESQLKTFIEADAKNYELQFGLAKLFNQSAKYDEETEVYKSIIKADIDGPSALKSKNALAARYLAENKIDEAKVLINQVLNKNAMDSDSLSMRGMLALSENRLDDAVSDFRSVLRDQPELVRVRKLLAKTHMQKGEFGLAKDNLQMALDVNKKDLDARLALASVWDSLDNKDESLSQIKQVLASAPKNIAALDLLFKNQFGNNELEASKETAGLIKTTYPDNALGYYFSGLVYAKNKETKKGIEQFKVALEKQSTAIEPLNYLVRLLISDKQYKQAISEIDKILKEHPDYIVAMNLKGETLMVSGDNDAARRIFEKVIEKNPKLITPYTNLADMEIRQKHFDKAIEIFQKGIDNGADKTSLQLQMASVFQRKGDHDKAITVYQNLMKDKPDLDVAANNLAMLLVSYKFEDEKSVKQALQLVEKFKETKNPAYMDTIGWTYYRAKEYETALPYLNKALSMAPDEPLLQYHAGMTLFESGEIEQARVMLEKSVESRGMFTGRNEAEATLSKIGELKTRAMN